MRVGIPVSKIREYAANSVIRLYRSHDGDANHRERGGSFELEIATARDKSLDEEFTRRVHVR